MKRMERIRGGGEASQRVSSHHRVSGTQARSVHSATASGEQPFPSHTFHVAYDAMHGWKGGRADVDYVRILHLAATAME